MEGPPRQFACSEKDCPFSTKHQSDMAKHVRTHTGERPYACTDCEYRSSRRDQLAAHMRRHTGERPYACTFPACAYKSVTAGTLRAHKKSHNVDGLRCDAGGGGLRGINHIYRIAPRDGTVIGAIDQQAPLAQAFGEKGVEYDLLKSSYVGNTTSSPIRVRP